MARKASTELLMSISGSVPPELHKALEDERWNRHKTMSQMVREGLEYFAKEQGLWTPPEAPAIDESKLTDAQREAIAADAERAEAAKAEQEAADKAAADAKAAEDAAKAEAEADKAGAQADDAATAEAAKAEAEATKTTSRARK